MSGTAIAAQLSHCGWSDERIAELLDCRARLAPEQQAEWDRCAEAWLEEEATAKRLSKRSDYDKARDADEIGESRAHWKYNRSWAQAGTLGELQRLAKSVGWKSLEVSP